jgi:two-component system chemotaxis response regulator CheY
VSKEWLIPRVLIVDDTWFQREKLISFFSQYGFTVVAEAENGVEGVELFERHKPDLVTMDVNMPFMGGIESVREIIGKHPDARIIMVSAMGDPMTIKEARLAGACDFIVKPFNSDILANKIEKLLKESFPDFYSRQKI